MTLCRICLALDAVQQSRDGSLICDRHFDRIWDLLSEIADSFAIIHDDEFLLSTQEPASHYTKSLPPCSLDVVSLRDARSRYARRGDPVSAERVLRQWARAVADSRGETWIGYDAPAVLNLAAYLKSRLVWISKQEAVTRFATHVACVADSLRRRLPADKSSEGADEMTGVAA